MNESREMAPELAAYHLGAFIVAMLLLFGLTILSTAGMKRRWWLLIPAAVASVYFRYGVEVWWS